MVRQFAECYSSTPNGASGNFALSLKGRADDCGSAGSGCPDAFGASEIEHSLEALAIGELHDINDVGGRGVVFITGTPFHWSELPLHLHPQQSRILEEYRRFAETLRVLLREQPQARLETFRDDGATVLDFVNRDPSSHSTARAALGDAIAALRRQVALIGGLYSTSAGTLLVPDTNALYWNPALEEWRVLCAPRHRDHLFHAIVITHSTAS